MLGIEDDTIFKDFEQEEWADPSLRKLMATASSMRQGRLISLIIHPTLCFVILEMLNLGKSCLISTGLQKLCLGYLGMRKSIYRALG
jgi:hypothetical protein